MIMRMCSFATSSRRQRPGSRSPTPGANPTDTASPPPFLRTAGTWFSFPTPRTWSRKTPPTIETSSCATSAPARPSSSPWDSKVENASVDEYLNPAISGTGRFIAFHTDSALVPGDTNDAVDVYVRDTESDTTRRVSRSSSDTQGNAASTGPSLSATGRVTAFTSAASNLVARDTNGKQDIFVHEWLAAP